MSFEPGGMADKLGNRYEGRWVARQLLLLLNEDILSVTIELIGPDEEGVDLFVVKKDGVRQFHQCKARAGNYNSWTVKALASYGILGHLKTHLSLDPQKELVLVSGIPAQIISDICESARNSNENPHDFYQYQIKEIGRERFEAFNSFCDVLELNPDKTMDLKESFSYLKRTYIELFPDDSHTWTDLLTWTRFLLTGEPETAIAILLAYADNNYKYRKSIYADDLRNHLANHHDIHPKRLEHDSRIAPAIEELQQQFSESIRPRLINGRIFPREETTRIIECIASEQDVVLQGAAGYGKSSVLFELTEYLRHEKIPYLPIRLDRRIPVNNAARFGVDMDLPDSPAYSLTGLAAGRKCVLILDQLDAIRWTAAHSSTAMDVCKELVRQVRSLREGRRNILIVFACKTFDLENDPEINSLLADTANHGFVKITVKDLSNEQLGKILGGDLAALTDAQKRILACPQHLAIWMELKKEGATPGFRSATELMRRSWENHRQTLHQKTGITPGEIDRFLQPLLDYMESRGEISAPASMADQTPTIRDALISNGILQESSRRINFCHQKYLDHLIAERLRGKIYKESGTVLSWLGLKENQSLFRREQLRQVLTMLAEESTLDFLKNARELLETEGVRFHLKHLSLELIGQLVEVSREVGKYCLGLMDEAYWRDHILETVFYGHHPWVSYLLEVGILKDWLSSHENQLIDRALWLLRSVAEYIPDQIVETLEHFVDKEAKWPEQVLNTLCWNESDDSDRMFELRLHLAKKGYVRESVNWASLCAKSPLRAIRLIEAVVSTWEIDEKNSATRKKTRLERWYDRDSEALKNAVKQYPTQTWDLLMGHIERLTCVKIDQYNPGLEKWQDSRFQRHETDIKRGVVELVMLAGKTLAAHNPDELTERIATLESSSSPVAREIIVSAYTNLPTTHADVGIAWLLGDPARFRVGSGFNEPEWMPAVRLISTLSPHCSKELFQQLENTVIHYHAPEEKEDAEYYLKGRRQGYFDHYWGKTQYFLLPALDKKRILGTTKDLIRVLKRKFKHYPTERFLRSGTISGGWIGSKLDPNIDRISDNTWLRIVSSENVTTHDNLKWIQVNSGRALATSIHQFASSFSRIAKRYPERFGQLALRFHENVHPRYISAILDGFEQIQPDPKLPEDERNSWQPARLETIEAVLNRYQDRDDRETAMSFCRLISERADQNWSKEIIDRLVHYAQNHPDLKVGNLNIHCDKSSDEATVETLFQNTINCVRGVAARAIGQLLWEQKDRFELVRPAIESLIRDPHPVVRMAAIEAILPVFNIDKDLAVQWFCDSCKDDLRVAASQTAIHFLKYAFPIYYGKLVPIIQQMVVSPLGDVAFEGAKQVTARWLFHGFFEEELIRCRVGTVPQRKGVVNVAVDLLHNREYSGKCQELLRHFINDSDKEVRDEFRSMFRKGDLLNNPENETFLKEYLRSKAFADRPDSFALVLKNFLGRIVPLAEAIFIVCEEFSTTLQKKSRDIGSRYPHTASEMSSILLRLYEQASGDQFTEIADHCLDIWDLLFENRVGLAIELTRSIDN